mgnify:CR=1 FL=1
MENASNMERQRVILLYRMMLHDNPQMLEAAKRELQGKDLVCWCAPLPCHGDILLAVANLEISGKLREKN